MRIYSVIFINNRNFNDKKKFWNGIEIRHEIRWNDQLILFGTNEIIILYKLDYHQNSLITFVGTILYFFHINEHKSIKDIFGIFFDIELNTIRVKFREEFLKDFNSTWGDIFSLITSNNKITYYSKREDQMEFSGIEIRFQESLNGRVDFNQIIMGISKETRELKKKLFNTIE